MVQWDHMRCIWCLYLCVFKLTNRKHLRFHNWPFTYRVYVFFDKMYLFHTELICGFHKPLINYKRDKLLWLWNQLCNVHADDYVPWWRHQMETFSALLVLCAGNSPVTGEFPAQRPVTRSFDVSLICARINGWVNNVEAGDLRGQCVHYDVIVMDWPEEYG